MKPEPSFDKLVERLRHGDEEAAKEVFQRFSHRLIALAGSRLQAMLRAKIDPEDVMQSVFKSFFARHVDGQFDLQNWESFWSILTVITLRKCGHRLNHFRAAKRDVQRERAVQGSPDDSAPSWEAVAREPTPAEAVMLTDLIEHLLRGLEDRDRQIVTLGLQGYTVSEISLQIGRSERTVHRVLERVRKYVQQLRGGDNG